MPRLRAQKTKTLLSSNDGIFPKIGTGLDTDESSLSRSGDTNPPEVSELGGRAGRREGRDGQ